MTELKKIERMTFYEYTLKMTAFQLKMVDEDYALHKAAWLAQQVKATKKMGKEMRPYYTSFEKFYDYAKRERMVLGQEEEALKDNNFSDLMMKANK